MSGTIVLFVTPEESTRPAPDLLVDSSEVAVVEESSLADAKETIESDQVDCLVTEYDLPDGTGIDLVRYVRDTAPDVGCILFTDTDRETVRDETDGRVVAEYVDKDAPDADERLAEIVLVTARRRTQTSYPLPDDEDERLAALERLDVGLPSLEAAFDRVTDLAAAHFDVDRAAVNVLTEHTQEVLVGRGVDWTTIPREDTICTYSILNDDVTVIEDTDTDPRFEGMDGLDDMRIRFYAGAPLTTDGGLSIGTLCLYDAEPRALSTEEVRVLELLADETMHWIDLHSRLPNRQESADTVGVQR